MEDALNQLSALARKESRCTRCSETAARRLRAVPGGGHPHAAVMIVSLAPSEADEAGDGEAGAGLVEELAAFMPALEQSRERVYVTTLLKCVPRGEAGVRPPTPEEEDNCFDYLSREISITTPHYILAVGEETTRFVLRKLFRDRPDAPGDMLELRVFDNPAFKVVPVAAPEELRARDAKEQKRYRDRLRQLARALGFPACGGALGRQGTITRKACGTTRHSRGSLPATSPSVCTRISLPGSTADTWAASVRK